MEVDRVGALLRAWLGKSPGKGALTMKFLQQLKTMKESAYQFVGESLDFTA